MLSEDRQGHRFPRFSSGPPRRRWSPRAPSGRGRGPSRGGWIATLARSLTHRHPRKTWFAQAMEKETSCWSCRPRLPLSASAASSVPGTRSPALRSRNSRRWRQCLSVSPSQRSVSTQAATRGFWLRYSDTSCAMLGPAGRGEREHAEPRAKRRAGRSARPAPAALPRTPLQKPKPQTTEQGADEPPTSACLRLAPFYNLAAATAAAARDLPARARSPGMLCGAPAAAGSAVAPTTVGGRAARRRRGRGD